MSDQAVYKTTYKNSRRADKNPSTFEIHASEPRFVDWACHMHLLVVSHLRRSRSAPSSNPFPVDPPVGVTGDPRVDGSDAVARLAKDDLSRTQCLPIRLKHACSLLQRAFQHASNLLYSAMRGDAQVLTSDRKGTHAGHRNPPVRLT